MKGKVIGNATNVLRDPISNAGMRSLLYNKKILNEHYFNLVDWGGIEATRNKLAFIFVVWTTKHLSGFCCIIYTLLDIILDNAANMVLPDNS